MEKSLDRVMDVYCNNKNLIGCIFADEKGLCIGVKGKATNDTAGLISAIANEATKLEPQNSKTPIIILENDNQLCIIQKHGNLTGAVFKQL